MPDFTRRVQPHIIFTLSDVGDIARMDRDEAMTWGGRVLSGDFDESILVRSVGSRQFVCLLAYRSCKGGTQLAVRRIAERLGLGQAASCP